MQYQIDRYPNLCAGNLPSRLFFIILLALTTAAAPLAVYGATPVDSIRAVPVSTSPSPIDTIGADAVAVGEDFLRFFSTPARWGWVGWSGFGGTIVGTALVTTIDDPLRTSFREEHSTLKDNLRTYGNLLGTPLPAAVLFGTLYSGGLIFDNRWMRLAGRHLFQSILYASVITLSVKSILGRHRPELNDGPYAFEGPTLRDEFNSLPSGHTTVAFALCSSLAADIDHPVATVILYTMAVYTGYSRMYDDRHWGSDVFLGAVVGTVCGYTVANMHISPDGKMGWSVTPTINGLAVNWVF